jgi:excinuclease ABC subunit C
MIDGGKGQLNAAAEAMRELDLEAIPMIGVVKPPRRHNEVSHLLVKGREHEPIFLDSHSTVLRLIQMIRDETHRAAVTYHRKRREIRDFTSELTEIPGVGDKRKNRLLRNFGSIARIAQATAAELAPFIGRQTAEEVAAHFARQRALAEGNSADAHAATAAIETDADEMPLEIETRLDDPEGDAADLQPIRSVDHAGEVRPPRKSTRKRGERSTNPHGVKRERVGKEGSS